MKDKLLKEIYRYTKEDKTYHIDVQLDNYRDVYNEWDYSPFLNRDLDEDLLDFLMSCSLEIPYKKKICIDFFLIDMNYDAKREERSINGIHNYFTYRIRQVNSEKFRLMRSTLTFFFMGAVMLFFSIFSDRVISNDLLESILSEGFAIGAWVAMWELFSIWFFELSKLNHKIKHYIRLQKCNIIYHYNQKN